MTSEDEVQRPQPSSAHNTESGATASCPLGCRKGVCDDYPISCEGPHHWQDEEHRWFECDGPPAEETPGLPDPSLIVGNWTGEDDTPQAREALAYRTLRANLVRVYRDALDRRAFWANSPADGAVARAVAYQSIAGSIHAAIYAADAVAEPRTRPGQVEPS